MSRNESQFFAAMYPRFVAGGRWLDKRKAAGQDVTQDTEDFIATVILPLHELWMASTADQRDALGAVMAIYDRLGRAMSVKGEEPCKTGQSGSLARWRRTSR